MLLRSLSLLLFGVNSCVFDLLLLVRGGFGGGFLVGNGIIVGINNSSKNVKSLRIKFLDMCDFMWGDRKIIRCFFGYSSKVIVNTYPILNLLLLYYHNKNSRAYSFAISTSPSSSAAGGGVKSALGFHTTLHDDEFTVSQKISGTLAMGLGLTTKRSSCDHTTEDSSIAMIWLPLA